MTTASARPPAAPTDHPALSCRPFFIVGCPRSGTTLLRLMLDSHPELAVPDESHFITELHGRFGWLADRRRPGATFQRVFEHQRFRRWGLEPGAVRELAAATRPNTFAEAIATVYEAYARSQGKTRWGDKTPDYVRHISRLVKVFPEAQVIHVIRDGREVARSIAGHRWGPPTAIAAAGLWRREVSQGRRDGQGLGAGRYLEVRLERLIAAPEAVLRQVCGFLEVQYAPQMLDYPATALARVWTGPPDSEVIDHRHLAIPPTGALRNWREGLSPRRQVALEAAAQPLLAQLGYAQDRRDVLARLMVQGDKVRCMPYRLRRGKWVVDGLGNELRSQLAQRGTSGPPALDGTGRVRAEA